MDVLAESSMPGGAQVLFLLGLGLMIVILLVRSRRYFRQVTQYQVPTPRAKSPRKPVSASSAPPKDYEKWEVSMHELARDLSGQLDTKIRVLELLIREANDAAARLETAMDRRSEVGSRKSEPRDTRERSEPISRDTRVAMEPKRATPSRESQAPLKIAGNPALRANLRARGRRHVTGDDRQANRQSSRRSRTHPQPPKFFITNRGAAKRMIHRCAQIDTDWR